MVVKKEVRNTSFKWRKEEIIILETIKMQNTKSLFVLLAVAIAVLGGYWYLNRNGEVGDVIVPGQGSSEEEQARLDEYEKNCPLEALLFEAETTNFNMIQVRCSYDPAYSTIDSGEESTVEIYTQDLEQGKQEFRDWLAENGLEEGERLRVTYEHKPN